MHVVAHAGTTVPGPPVRGHARPAALTSGPGGDPATRHAGGRRRGPRRPPRRARPARRHGRHGGAQLRPHGSRRPARPLPHRRARRLGGGGRPPPHRRGRDPRSGGRGARRQSARPRRRVAHRRLPPDPQPRHAGREPRHRRRRRPTPSAPSAAGAEVELHPPRRPAPRAGRAFVTGPKRTALARRRADRRRAVSRPPAGRQVYAKSAPATPWSSRRLRARGSRSTRSAARRGVAVGAAGPDATRAPAAEVFAAAALDWEAAAARPRRPGARSASSWRRRPLRARRRPRHGRLQAPRPPRSWPAARSRGPGAWRGARVGLTCASTACARERPACGRRREPAARAARRLGLPAPKNACEQGECGSCTVDRRARLVCACLVLAGPGGRARGPRPWPGWPRRRAAPRAGGVPRGRRRPVRLLHPGARRWRRATSSRACRDPSDAEIREASPATSAAARATRRSSTRCGWRPSGMSARTVIEGCAIATVDAGRHGARRRAPRGRGRPDRRRGRRAGTRRHGAAASTAAAARHARPGQLPPPPLPVGDARPAQEATLFEWLGRSIRCGRASTRSVEPRPPAPALAALARSGCTTTTDHHYVFPRGAGDLLAVEIEAARDDRPALPPLPRVDGPRRGRTAACRRT